jgi:TonB family protein
MEQNFNKHHDPGADNQPKTDRSLLYMGIGLGLVILIMGYLTLYVDDAASVFSGKEEIKTASVEDSSDVLNENSAMDDDEVRNSLIKFIEVFYTDQKKGYFDPPSYFPSITRTYYNYHNLTYQRIKDIHWKRMADMKNFDLNWIVSTLDYDRSGNELIASYWTTVSYFQPSRNQEVSADIRYEMTINEEGKISSLRELEIRNLVQSPRSSNIDTSSTVEAEPGLPSNSSEKEIHSLSTTESGNEGSRYEGKLYDLGNVELAPEYQGGQKALGKFLGSRLRYPVRARENKIQGKVYIGFVIEKNGSLSDFKVIRGIGGGCDEEAIRVLKLSPLWKPGYSNGKPVRTSYTLPITFQLGN